MIRSKAFEVLGLDSNATTEEIKTAYAELSKKYHPEENPKEFQEIHEAYVTLTRGSRRGLRMPAQISLEHTENEDKPAIEENAFDFSGIEVAKQKEQEEEIQRVVRWLDDVIYSDKKINHVLLKVILNYKKREVIYSKEVVEKLIDIIQKSFVDKETANVIKKYIRLWDTSLYDKREGLNKLDTVVQKREEEYRTKYIFEERQAAAKMVLLVIMFLILPFFIIIDFFGVIKLLFAGAILYGISVFVYRICIKRKSDSFGIMMACLVDVLLLLLSFYFGFYKWFMNRAILAVVTYILCIATLSFFVKWKTENK